jgi:hypothetical protein
MPDPELYFWWSAIGYFGGAVMILSITIYLLDRYGSD